MEKFDESEGRWVTINGTHIFIQDKDGERREGSKTSGRQPSFVRKSVSGQTEVHKNVMNRVWLAHKAEHKAEYAKLKELFAKKEILSKDVEVLRQKRFDITTDPKITDTSVWEAADKAYNDKLEEWSKAVDAVKTQESHIIAMKLKIRDEAIKEIFPTDRPDTAFQTLWFTPDVGSDLSKKCEDANYKINGFVVSNKLEEVVISISDDSRCHEDHGNILLDRTAQEKDIIHEMGHVLETRDPGILSQSIKFLNDRTLGDSWEYLAKLYPWASYRPDERVKRDKFLDEYCGKDYGGRATEIVSMGLQFLIQRPVEFAVKDPDYFNFMVRVCKGVKPKRTRKKRTVKTSGKARKR